MIPNSFAAFVTFAWLLACRCVAGETATAVATVTAGYVTAITVTSGGSGYKSDPAVTLSGGGGSGATAKAILSGGKVSQIVILSAGKGYATPPIVAVEAPRMVISPRLRLVPELTVNGPPGSVARIEWSTALSGPWVTWTNMTFGIEGAVLLDLSPGATGRFYRITTAGPAGFVWIPPGNFEMGSPIDEEGRNDDEIRHVVTITRGFWLSDHEVTQAEHQAVMGYNPSEFKDPDRPVEMVSWNAAVVYCEKLTELERTAGRITGDQEYRLPTEAEWEYAARAGTTGTRYGELDAIAWYAGNSGGNTHPVRGKRPNPWGLYDMLGNVAEWCLDWYGGYPQGEVTDPVGAVSGQARVLRGGSWALYDPQTRPACRRALMVTPGQRLNHIGFRVALSEVR
jgi:formylglycine-generating enzyme required for sulfatase activity